MAFRGEQINYWQFRYGGEGISYQRFGHGVRDTPDNTATYCDCEGRYIIAGTLMSRSDGLGNYALIVLSISII